MHQNKWSHYRACHHTHGQRIRRAIPCTPEDVTYVLRQVVDDDVGTRRLVTIVCLLEPGDLVSVRVELRSTCRAVCARRKLSGILSALQVDEVDLPRNHDQEGLKDRARSHFA
jgi:hypothetical protein